jgi:hypothetical protein
MLTTILASCSQDSRAADINGCIAEAEQEASQGTLNDQPGAADNAEERHDKIGVAVSDCMAKAGYRHANKDMIDERCVDDVDFNPFCYRKGS